MVSLNALDQLACDAERRPQLAEPATAASAAAGVVFRYVLRSGAAAHPGGRRIRDFTSTGFRQRRRAGHASCAFSRTSTRTGVREGGGLATISRPLPGVFNQGFACPYPVRRAP